MTKSKVDSKVTKKVNTKKVAKKVIKKVRKKKVVTLSTKPKNRVLMKGDNNYPQSNIPGFIPSFKLPCFYPY